jgi:hypothetical protein
MLSSINEEIPGLDLIGTVPLSVGRDLSDLSAGSFHGSVPMGHDVPQGVSKSEETLDPPASREFNKHIKDCL